MSDKNLSKEYNYTRYLPIEQVKPIVNKFNNTYGTNYDVYEFLSMVVRGDLYIT